MSTAGSMIGLSKKIFKKQMLSRVWNLSPRNEFAEKLRKKTGGAFLYCPRFASAHCNIISNYNRNEFVSLERLNFL